MVSELQESLSGALPMLQVPQVQVPERQLWVPGQALTLQVRDEPMRQGKPSSGTVSQSSSIMLHVSTGGVQSPGAGSAQVSLHNALPVVPQNVVQGSEAPRMHGKPSSRTRSQSSSSPLHVSAGGEHEAPVGRVQLAVQTPLPVLPQVVVQLTVVARWQA
jgi:hypothetical protein